MRERVQIFSMVIQIKLENVEYEILDIEDYLYEKRYILDLYINDGKKWILIERGWTSDANNLEDLKRNIRIFLWDNTFDFLL